MMDKPKKHVGLLFGSFNPIHIGHLALANYMREMQGLDEVWLVVSPQNPFKESEQLVDGKLRLQMVELAIKNAIHYKVCNIELEMPKPSYTILTLEKLNATYPACKFSLIMGTDNIQSIHKWMNGDQILSDFKIFIYPRNGYDPSNNVLHPNVIYTQAPVINISSTYIRQQLNLGHKMDFFMPDGVGDFIENRNLYRRM